MRTIIAGSREITDYETVVTAIKNSGFEITAVISGHAPGVDQLGEKYAEEVLKIKPEIYEADWDHFGKAAGMIRNSDMAANAESLIAVQTGDSKGTEDMIKKAKKKGLKIFVQVV